jgi:hypothetical protein
LDQTWFARLCPLDRALPKGPHHLSRDEVAQSQRGRLTYAITALVDEKGYAGTTVADVLRAALRRAPEDTGVLRELGHLFIDLERPGSAAEQFRRAVEVEPGDDDFVQPVAPGALTVGCRTLGSETAEQRQVFLVDPRGLYTEPALTCPDDAWSSLDEELPERQATQNHTLVVEDVLDTGPAAVQLDRGKPSGPRAGDAGEHHRPGEVGHEGAARHGRQVARGALLHHLARVDHPHPVAERRGLREVVRDEHGRHLHVAQHGGQLDRGRVRVGEQVRQHRLADPLHVGLAQAHAEAADLDEPSPSRPVELVA